MGFEPFVIPRRGTTDTGSDKTPQQARSRDERIAQLAAQLHQRGLTSSMTDARRLAEGMVDVERKVLDRAPSSEKPDRGMPASAMPASTHSSSSSATSKMSMPSVQSSAYPERFVKFIGAASTIHEEHALPKMPISAPIEESRLEPKKESTPTESTPVASSPAPRPNSISYGRENIQYLSEVPHTSASRQVFFEDAPPITAARGYSGPKPQKIDYPSQKLDLRPKPRVDPASAIVSPLQPGVNAETVVEETMTVVVEENATMVTRIDETPVSKVVQEEMIIQDELTKPALVTSVVPTSVAPSAPELRPAVQDKPAEKKEERPANGPGSVDIFEFFKKKS